MSRLTNNEQASLGEAAILAAICLTVGIGFITGWITGNPIITIGVGLITLPVSFIVFMFAAIAIEWLIGKV